MSSFLKKAYQIGLIFLTSYGIYFLLNYFNLRSWSLSGDDLYSLTHSISQLPVLITQLFTQFSGQYRHLTYFFFSFYDLLTPHFTLILLLHGLLFSSIPVFLYLIYKDRLPTLYLAALILPLFFTPIFYYHVYTISSLANLLMCLISLEMLYYFEHSKKIPSWKYSLAFFVLLVLSVAVKETFIVPLTMYVITQLRLAFNKNHKNTQTIHLVFALAAIGIFVVYALMRWLSYQADVPSDYYFIFSFNQVKISLGHIVAWLVNYPKGWQFGAPIRYMPWQLLISSGMAAIILVHLSASLYQKRIKTINYLLFIGASLVLFLFLNNIHLFYMDLPFLFTIVILISGSSYLAKKYPLLEKLLLGGWLLLSITNLYLIKPQWLEYSFVARANTTAINYRKLLQENNADNYQQICIANHQRGVFGTEDGQLANHLYKKQFTILSIPDDNLPARCDDPTSLNIRNDAWEYYLYSTE